MMRRYWKENPLWGEDRIAGELCKLLVSGKSSLKFWHEFAEIHSLNRGT